MQRNAKRLYSVYHDGGLNEMVAINLLSKKSYEVFEADRFVKRIWESCEFWFEDGSYTILLSRIFDAPEEGFEYSCYRINGNLYKSLLTNSHDELIRLAPKIVQETLF